MSPMHTVIRTVILSGTRKHTHTLPTHFNSIRNTHFRQHSHTLSLHIQPFSHALIHHSAHTQSLTLSIHSPFTLHASQPCFIHTRMRSRSHKNQPSCLPCKQACHALVLGTTTGSRNWFWANGHRTDAHAHMDTAVHGILRHCSSVRLHVFSTCKLFSAIWRVVSDVICVRFGQVKLCVFVQINWAKFSLKPRTIR